VEAPRGSHWAELKALYAALAVLALEPPKRPTAALPKALLSSAEIRILKSLGYIYIHQENDGHQKNQLYESHFCCL